MSKYLSDLGDVNEVALPRISNIISILDSLIANEDQVDHFLPGMTLYPYFKDTKEYMENVEMGIQGIPIIEHLLDDEVSQYLLISHSADELRPTGGFVSGLWLLTVNGGKIDKISYYDIVDVDDMSRISDYPEVPNLLRMYMGAEIWLLRDVSWGPDIDTTAKAARDMFGISTEREVDGVIGVNQKVLLNIVSSLGELNVSDGFAEKVSAKEVISYVEERSDTDGRIFADALFRALLNQLNETKSLGQILSLADSIKRSVDSNDLWVYSFEEEVQSTIERLNLNPILKRNTGDYLYIIDSNVGWSKSDSNLQRKFVYKIDLIDVQNPFAELVLNYKNHSGNTAAACEPQWIDRGDKYSQLKNACHWNLIRVFTPAEGKLLESSKFEIPSLSIPVVKWGFEPDFDSLKKSNFNENLDQISGLVVIAPGQSISKTVRYELPKNTVKVEGNCVSYKLAIKKQPGISGRNGLVEVFLPSGSVVKHLSENIETHDNRLTVPIFLTEDINIQVDFIINRAVSC